MIEVLDTKHMCLSVLQSINAFIGFSAIAWWAGKSDVQSHTRHVFCHLNLLCYIALFFLMKTIVNHTFCFCEHSSLSDMLYYLRGVNFIQNLINKMLSFQFDVVCLNKIWTRLCKMWDGKSFVHFIRMFSFDYKGILLAVDNI